MTSTLLEGHLAHGSLIPTNVYSTPSRFQPRVLTPALQNTFSERLSPHGFDLYKMLVVDVLHEVELGVWKAVFIQLLRLMEASNKGSINKLDER